MTERASLSRTVSGSVLGAAMLPLRMALWILNAVFWLGIPAFLFAALLHGSIGETRQAVRDGLFLMVCAAALGLMRVARERLRF